MFAFKFNLRRYIQGSYTDFDMGWYNKVMVVMLGTAIVNSVSFPLTRIVGAVGSHVMRGCRGQCASSQLALNRLYRPAAFELSQRYGQMMCVLFYTVGRCSLTASKPELTARLVSAICAWKLKCDVPLSNVAFKFNLRRYNAVIFFVAAPPLFPIAAFYAILTYVVDKIVLLKVGRCRLPASKPVLKAPMVSALDAII
jgi:hypothetical protein